MCNKKLNWQTAIPHIAASHSFVENFLPPEHHVRKLKRGGYKRKHQEQQHVKNNSSRVTCISNGTFDATNSKEVHVLDESNEGPLTNNSNVTNVTNKITSCASLHKCFICTFSAARRKDMYRHYSCRHFKHRILEELDGRKSCNYCDKEFASMTTDNIAQHIGVVHMAVEKLLAPAHIIKKNAEIERTRKKQLKAPNKSLLEIAYKSNSDHVTKKSTACHVTKKSNGCPVTKKNNAGPLTKKSNAGYVTNKIRKRYMCSQCNSSFSKRTYLYSHYAAKHFGDQIKQNYGKWQNKDQVCPLCEKQLRFGDSWKWLKHLGVVHNIVEEFLDEKHHIPKNKQQKSDTCTVEENLALVEPSDDIYIDRGDEPNTCENLTVVEVEDPGTIYTVGDTDASIETVEDPGTIYTVGDTDTTIETIGDTDACIETVEDPSTIETVGDTDTSIETVGDTDTSIEKVEDNDTSIETLYNLASLDDIKMEVPESEPDDVPRKDVNKNIKT